MDCSSQTVEFLQYKFYAGGFLSGTKEAAENFKYYVRRRLNKLVFQQNIQMILISIRIFKRRRDFNL